MLYFVSIHMVPLVPRGPVGKVYGDVTEAFYVDLTSEVKSMGKGLTIWHQTGYSHRVHDRVTEYRNIHGHR